MNNRISQVGRGKISPCSATILLLCALLFAGCNAEATPEPAAEVAPTATGSLAVVAEPTPEATVTSLPSTPTIEIEAQEVETSASISETAEVDEGAAAAEDEVSEGSTVRDESGNCLTEFALDLAGYPDLEESMGCAIQEASFDPVAINEFGPGPDHQKFMLWFGTTEQIVVLLPNATWQGYLNAWSEGEAEIQCNPTGGPNESPPLPRRGFGKLWCSDPEIQSQMGTIEREERLCQHAVLQRFEQGRLVACFEDATIRYFRILEDGSWSHLLVQ